MNEERMDLPSKFLHLVLGLKIHDTLKKKIGMYIFSGEKLDSSGVVARKMGRSCEFLSLTRIVMKHELTAK
jgi:hypothetical protein